MRISDWSSDVCSSDLGRGVGRVDRSSLSADGRAYDRGSAGAFAGPLHIGASKRRRDGDLLGGHDASAGADLRTTSPQPFLRRSRACSAIAAGLPRTMCMLERLAFAGAFWATPCWPRQWAGGRLCFFMRQSLSTILSKVDSGVAGVGAGRMPTERVPALCGHCLRIIGKRAVVRSRHSTCEDFDRHDEGTLTRARLSAQGAFMSLQKAIRFRYGQRPEKEFEKMSRV